MGWRAIYRRESGSVPKVDSLCTGMRDSVSPIEICIENDYLLFELNNHVNGVMTCFTPLVSWSVESPGVGPALSTTSQLNGYTPSLANGSTLH